MKKIRMAVVALLAAGLLAPSPTLAAPLQPGAEVPEIERAQFGSSEMFKLSSMKGQKAVVFEFSNSACGNCQALTEYLKPFHGKSANHEIIMVNVDRKGGNEKWNEIMKQIVEQEQIPMRIILDPKFTIAQMFGITVTPALVVIDKSGKLVATHVGYTAADNDKVKQLLDSAK